MDTVPPSSSLASSSTPSSSPQLNNTEKIIKPWNPPSEIEDTRSRKEFLKLLDRGIIRDNGYKPAAECCETLLKISTNILENPDEPKFRTLKAGNKLLKDKIISAKGGHDYLIALGFRTTTVDFIQHYTVEPTPKRLHTLKLGNEVLNSRLPALQARLTTVPPSTALTKKKEESERAAAAIRNAEADREIVKQRVEREKFAREAKAARIAEAGTEGHVESHGRDGGRDDRDERDGEDEEDEEDDDGSQNGEEAEEDEAQETQTTTRRGGGGGYRLGGA